MSCRQEKLCWRKLLCGAGLIFYLGLILFGPALAPNDPLQTDIGNRLSSYSSQYPLGTDPLGRCALSRLLTGARGTLLASATVLALTVTTGTVFGLVSGYSGGAVDYLLQRILDGVMAFPGLILALAIAGILGPGLEHTVIALALVHWAGYARIVRTMTLSLRERTYVKASQLSGAGRLSIFRRHLLPEILPTLTAVMLLDYGRIIISFAGLSFLGLGVQPPLPEWGAMMAEGKPYMQGAPQLVLWPGLLIAGLVLSLQAGASLFEKQETGSQHCFAQGSLKGEIP
jgi:ABC-type dipeptide/oligopeptide/nickel transport system permease subunit